MNNLPKIVELEFDTEEIVENLPNLGKSFLFDFDKCEFVFENGKMVLVADVEALKIWITKVLKTEKFRFKIYEKAINREDEYGVTIEDLIGAVLPHQFVQSELKREIENALLKHPRIEYLSSFEIEQVKDRLYINFRVNLIDGETFESGVSFVNG